MLKKFIHGLIFGTGFTIAVIGILTLYNYIVIDTYVTDIHQEQDRENIINNAPLVSSKHEYLGSTGIYASHTSNISRTLAKGPGKIVGKVTVDDLPISGLKLKLTLNKAVASHWVVTNSHGEYAVSVPFGEYRIDGFTIDHAVANQVVPGKILHPHSSYQSDKFNVSSKVDGIGITIKFVTPIIKNINKKAFTLSEKIDVSWNETPKAHAYEIQIFEKDEPNDFRGNTNLFDWMNRPKVKTSGIDLSAYKSKFSPGKYYVVEISALNERGKRISSTPDKHTGYDFKIIE